MGWQLVPTGIGWREFSRASQRGQFTCSNPKCKGRKQPEQPFELRSGRNWFTVFFIPLIPLNSTGTWVKCTACKTVHPVSVLPSPGSLPPPQAAVAEPSPSAPLAAVPEAATPEPASALADPEPVASVTAIPETVAPVPATPEPIAWVPSFEVMTGPSVPRLPAPPSPAATAMRGSHLVWEDGTLLTFDRVAVVGREPTARPDDELPLLVRVAGDDLVSKTHLAIGRSGAGVLWLEDRHSTNGVSVERDGRRLDAVAGVRFPLEPRDVVTFGQQRLRVATEV